MGEISIEFQQENSKTIPSATPEPEGELRALKREIDAIITEHTLKQQEVDQKLQQRLTQIETPSKSEQPIIETPSPENTPQPIQPLPQEQNPENPLASYAKLAREELEKTRLESVRILYDTDNTGPKFDELPLSEQKRLSDLDPNKLVEERMSLNITSSEQNVIKQMEKDKKEFEARQADHREAMQKLQNPQPDKPTI